MARLISHPSTTGRQVHPGFRAGQGDLIGRQVSGKREASRSAAGDVSQVLPLSHETEDTQITGGTRSLVRRLMALNVAGTLRKQSQAETVLHETKIA